ncbi:hypothetical protein ACF07F_16635 [Streptomyces sp. NPDC015237]|uniref:hypothetical protein n=1 Tax=Streptomyces sp. NPDC015237 TaxID=3364949 RepID=UPI0036FB5103
MTGPACGNNPHHQLTDGDRQALDNFKAYLADRGALRQLIAEAIHEDLLAHKGRLDQGLLGIVPRLTNAVLARLAPDPVHGAIEAPGRAGRDDNGQPARADLLNTFAAWLFTTGRGSRQVADRILGKHRAEVLREAEAALSERAKRLTGEFNDSDILHEDGPAATVATWKRAAELARRMADETQPAETETQQVAVDTLARLLCDADVHVNNGDYPGWDDLSTTPGLGQDEVRKAARFLLKRLHITERQPAAGARQDGEGV